MFFFFEKMLDFQSQLLNCKQNMDISVLHLIIPVNERGKTNIENQRGAK